MLRLLMPSRSAPSSSAALPSTPFGNLFQSSSGLTSSSISSSFPFLCSLSVNTSVTAPKCTSPPSRIYFTQNFLPTRTHFWPLSPIMPGTTCTASAMDVAPTLAPFICVRCWPRSISGLGATLMTLCMVTSTIKLSTICGLLLVCSPTNGASLWSRHSVLSMVCHMCRRMCF